MIRCKFCGNNIAENAIYCERCGNAQKSGVSQRFQPRQIAPGTLLCVNCGHLGSSVQVVKGSIALEALLLILSVLVAFFNLLFGGVIFLFFVGYCIWRLSSKHTACPGCKNTNLIPANSPVASRFLSGQS